MRIRRQAAAVALCLVCGLTVPACLFIGLLLAGQALQPVNPAQTGTTTQE